MRRLVFWSILYSMACVGSVGLSATGDLLMQYDSALGTLPADQAWSYDSLCLRTRCPQNATPPPAPGYVSECWFQGQSVNDCKVGHGCGPDAGATHGNEHFNAPNDPITVTGACSYTEWLAFDNGEDYLGQSFPVSPPHRNLTFAMSYWPGHTHPAFGAPGFLNAPVGHTPLRIVTGGGVPNVQTLPATGTSKRNSGKIKIYRSYSLLPGTGCVTLVAKMACGNRLVANELIGVSGFGYLFCVGVDGQDGSPQLGRFARGSTRSTTVDMFGTRTVGVALARQNLCGPHNGEFFTLRVILKNDGTVQAWLNEDPSTYWLGRAGTGSGSVVQINPDEQAGTMWVDYVRVYEGAVLPPLCADPIFDVNRDGRVDSIDRQNGYDGFLDCATAPAVPWATIGSLPDKCECHDRNRDGVVDMIDFAAFQRCLTATGTALNSGCDD